MYKYKVFQSFSLNNGKQSELIVVEKRNKNVLELCLWKKNIPKREIV